MNTAIHLPLLWVLLLVFVWVQRGAVATTLKKNTKPVFY